MWNVRHVLVRAAVKMQHRASRQNPHSRDRITSHAQMAHTTFPHRPVQPGLSILRVQLPIHTLAPSQNSQLGQLSSHPAHLTLERSDRIADRRDELMNGHARRHSLLHTCGQRPFHTSRVKCQSPGSACCSFTCKYRSMHPRRLHSCCEEYVKEGKVSHLFLSLDGLADGGTPLCSTGQ